MRLPARSRFRAGASDPLGGIGLVLYVVLALLPILGAIAYALAYSVGLTGLLSSGFTLEAWRGALSAGEVWSSLALSAGIACTVAGLASLAGVALALGLEGRLASGPLSYVLYVPLALPFTVAALVAFQWFTRSGLFSRLLLHLGLIESLEEATALVNDPWALGIIATHLFIATPFLALVFHRLAEQDRLGELRRLAATLGASRWQFLFRVSLPLLLWRGASNIALVFVVVLGSYEVPLLLGRQSPQMLSVLIMRKYGRFDITDKPEAFAIAVLYTLSVLALLAVVFGRRVARSREVTR